MANPLDTPVYLKARELLPIEDGAGLEVNSRQSLDHPRGRSRGQNYRQRRILRARPAGSIAHHRPARPRPARRAAGQRRCQVSAPARGVSAMARTHLGLVRVLRLPAGECVTLRPIDPRDAGVLQAYVRGLSPESRYNRFFGALRELPGTELDRVIHLNREYELALLAETCLDGALSVIGETRLFAPDRLEVECALSVADGWRGKGLGTLLVADMEYRARRLRARHLGGDVLRTNEPVRALARKTGFVVAGVSRDARMIRFVKDSGRKGVLPPGLRGQDPFSD
jgi:GNAT superfamily N-acetyltransferase